MRNILAVVCLLLTACGAENPMGSILDGIAPSNPPSNNPPQSSGPANPGPSAPSSPAPIAVDSTGLPENYRALCIGCHGADGKGDPVQQIGPIGPGACQVANCYNAPSLTQYITANMPRNSAFACQSACASEIADYIIANFTNNAPDLPPPPPPEDVSFVPQDYFFNCSSCHGNRGEGNPFAYDSPIGPGMCSRVNCANVGALANYISSAMPPVNPGFCTGQCAQISAQFIAGGFMAQANSLLKIFSTAVKTSHIEVYDQETGHKLFDRPPIEPPQP